MGYSNYVDFPNTGAKWINWAVLHVVIICIRSVVRQQVSYFDTQNKSSQASEDSRASRALPFPGIQLFMVSSPATCFLE